MQQSIFTPAQQAFITNLHAIATANDAIVPFAQKFLSVTAEQGSLLYSIATKNNCKICIEFGSSLGISTMYLAAAMQKTGGKVLATERMPQKAETLQKHLQAMELEQFVNVYVGDALQTLANWSKPIDLLFLDGQKNMYWQMYTLLKPNFKKGTIIVADNTETHFTREYKAKILADLSVQNTVHSWERSEMIVSTVS